MNDVLTNLEIEVKSNLSDEQLKEYLKEIKEVGDDIKNDIVKAWDSLTDSAKKAVQTIVDVVKS